MTEFGRDDILKLLEKGGRRRKLEKDLEVKLSILPIIH